MINDHRRLDSPKVSCVANKSEDMAGRSEAEDMAGKKAYTYLCVCPSTANLNASEDMAGKCIFVPKIWRESISSCVCPSFATSYAPKDMAGRRIFASVHRWLNTYAPVGPSVGRR